MTKDQYTEIACLLLADNRRDLLDVLESTTGYHMAAEIERLRAENEALRKDAERWRKLQAMHKNEVIAGMNENAESIRYKPDRPHGLTERVDAAAEICEKEPANSGTPPVTITLLVQRGAITLARLVSSGSMVLNLRDHEIVDPERLRVITGIEVLVYE